MRNVKAGHSKPIVCLDAGHAGKYNRSPAVKTYYESEMNWKLHNYLAAELESYGIEVKKTRPSQEKDLSLSERGKVAKGCDVFLSIHSNAVGNNVDETVDYVRVYHLYEDNGTDVDDQSKALARLLAPVIADTMGVKQGWNLATRKSTYDSNGDGVMNDNYYGVLNHSRLVGTAGMILEHSFHTNTRSTKWLLEDANLRKLAKAEAAVIAEWFGVVKNAEKPTQTPVEKPAEKPAEYLYRVQTGVFSKIENAQAQVEKLKAAGFEAIIKTEKVEAGSEQSDEPEPPTEPKVEPEGSFWDEIKHFKREEFRCKCGGKYCNGFPVEPAEKLVRLADRVREHFGEQAIVSSGVRCETHNARVGGVPGSRHLYGTAMDFRINGLRSAVVLPYIEAQSDVNYTYAIDSDYIHMDVVV